MIRFILDALEALQNGYAVCGMVDRRGRIYPIGSDTKVISTIFEVITRQVIASYAEHAGFDLKEPDKQNHYPDFTLMKGSDDRGKIAIDVKTTYRKHDQQRFSYTLGSYTSYINPATESKNIVYPYSDYSEHWVIGFVYKRMMEKRAVDPHTYTIDQLRSIPLPFDDVGVFMREKWRIAGDKAGSGNTTNIGSLKRTLDEFRSGEGIFESEAEFLEYWRGYKPTALERKRTYSNVGEFRASR